MSIPKPNILIHPGWLRALHWIHFYAVGLMFWSGLMIYWAYQAYSFPLFGQTYKVVPPIIFDWLGIRFSLAKGLAIHFNVMWVIMLCGILYLILSFWKGNFKNLVPRISDFIQFWNMVADFLKIKPGFVQSGKYNPAQKLAYFATILAGIILVLSGWAIYKPARLSWLTNLFGGYRSARAVHFWTTFYLLAFFIIHIVQVIRAGWKNFAAMVTGYQSGFSKPVKK